MAHTTSGIILKAITTKRSAAMERSVATNASSRSFGLEHRDSGRKSILLHGAHARSVTASGRAIRCGDHRGHLYIGGFLVNTPQAFHGKFRCAKNTIFIAILLVYLLQSALQSYHLTLSGLRAMNAFQSRGFDAPASGRDDS